MAGNRLRGVPSGDWFGPSAFRVLFEIAKAKTPISLRRICLAIHGSTANLTWIARSADKLVSLGFVKKIGNKRHPKAGLYCTCQIEVLHLPALKKLAAAARRK